MPRETKFVVGSAVGGALVALAMFAFMATVLHLG